MKKVIASLIILCMIFVTSCGFSGSDNSEKPSASGNESVPADTVKTEKITLYYTNKDALGLYAEEREVDSSVAKDAQAVAEELLKGTTSDELINVIPQGTKLNSCVVEDGLCTLDLTAEFISKNGTANEQLSIYSVVNTLCLLDDVEEVKFLIDGKEIMIYGSYIFDEPFGPDSTIIK